ncbi:MAG: hypothetical protein MR576_09035 [Firmicutes bacterium]|nr:hypothetical protein [Bacillota bacterium]
MKTVEEIHKIREEKRKELEFRVNKNCSTREKHILVCQRNRLHFFKISRNYRKIP